MRMLTPSMLSCGHTAVAHVCVMARLVAPMAVLLEPRFGDHRPLLAVGPRLAAL